MSSTQTIEVTETIQTERLVEVPRGDVISIQGAAEIAGVDVSTMSRWVGTILPAYSVRGSGRRYTSRKAVESRKDFLAGLSGLRGYRLGL